MEENYPSVSSLFDKYLKVYEEVECTTLPTNSDKVQEKVKDALDGLVKTTVLVSELGVFSSNESLEDLPTSSIKFILLPVLLGIFSTKRTDIDRLEVLRLANIYFRDFMSRCKQYGFTDIELPQTADSDSEDEHETQNKSNRNPTAPKKGMPTPEELREMAKQREAKIKRFKEKKSTGDKLLELKKVLTNPNTDEDVIRNYYITLVKKFIYDSLEELESIEMEQKMLRDMAALKMKGVNMDRAEEPKPRPLRPILITRDAVQKNVFGLGYPSLPTITIEEFYDQRVRDGWFPDPSKRQQQNCLQDRAAQDAERLKEQEDREEKEKEAAEERDDLETLARDRERDEWRDNHRRGWGNTYNRS